MARSYDDSPVIDRLVFRTLSYNEIPREKISEDGLLRSRDSKVKVQERSVHIDNILALDQELSEFGDEIDENETDTETDRSESRQSISTVDLRSESSLSQDIGTKPDQDSANFLADFPHLTPPLDYKVDIEASVPVNDSNNEMMTKEYSETSHEDDDEESDATSEQHESHEYFNATAEFDVPTDFIDNAVNKVAADEEKEYDTLDNNEIVLKVDESMLCTPLPAHVHNPGDQSSSTASVETGDNKGRFGKKKILETLRKKIPTPTRKKQSRDDESLKIIFF